MKFTSAILALPFLGLASALPHESKDTEQNWGQWNKCLSRSVGEKIVTQFGSLLSNFNSQTATNLLNSNNFTDTSDSINFIAGIPLGSTTFPSAQAFIGGQGSQPAIDFSVLAVDSVSCDGVIAFRWQAGVGSKKDPVKGINILYASLNNNGDANQIGPNGWQLTRVFSEFNSGAWVVDIGGTCAAPSRKLF